jgi:hypothetical protein
MPAIQLRRGFEDSLWKKHKSARTNKAEGEGGDSFHFYKRHEEPSRRISRETLDARENGCLHDLIAESGGPPL